MYPSHNQTTSCFLNNAQINDLYTFAFNISDSHHGRPPQCSNLTISWPTSLKSEIDNGTKSPSKETNGWMLDRRETSSVLPTIDPAEPVDAVERAEQPVVQTLDARGSNDDFSSGANRTTGKWNTTTPPTLFGIIPLGNSFSIPVTYDKAKQKLFGLPDEYLSHDPTTWTEKGVTSLNWTVNLAKGTRFILVAGIGSQEQWASGGSSEMMTVGQGPNTCFNVGGPKPSVTLSGTSTGALDPTDSPGTGQDKSPTGGHSTSRWTGVILACIFSVLGTALLCILLWCCCRVRRERKQAVQAGRPKPSFVNLATFGKLDRKYKQPDTQLDLIGPDHRDDGSDGTPTHAGFGQRPYSTVTTGYDRGSMGSESFADYNGYPYSPPPVGTRSSLYDAGVPFRSSLYDRASTYDEITPYYAGSPTTPSTPAPGVGTPGTPGAAGAISTLPRRNQSHDHMGDLGLVGGMDVTYPPMAHSLPPLKRQLLLGESDPDSTEHLAQLKRDTIAALDRPGESSRGSSSTNLPAILTVDTNIDPAMGGISPSPISGLEDDNDPQGAYVVHRDAGRIPNSPTAPQNRVVELPPRYEELNWDREASDDVIEEAEALGTVLASPSSPAGVRHPLPLPPGARSPPRTGSPLSPGTGPGSPLSGVSGSPLGSPAVGNETRRETHGIV